MAERPRFEQRRDGERCTDATPTCVRHGEHEVDTGDAGAEEHRRGGDRLAVEPAQIVPPCRIFETKPRVDLSDPAGLGRTFAEALAQRLRPDFEVSRRGDATDDQTGRDRRSLQGIQVGGHADLVARMSEALVDQSLSEIGRRHAGTQMPGSRYTVHPQAGDRCRDPRAGIAGVEPGADDGVVIVDGRSADGPAQVIVALFAAAGAAHRDEEFGAVRLDGGGHRRRREIIVHGLPGLIGHAGTEWGR
jgi:hypothetical protein